MGIVTAPASAATSPPAVHDSLQEKDWKQLTVGSFLEQVNWSNQSEPAVPRPQPAAVSAEDLHLQMSVSQFFSVIPWTGEMETETRLPAIDAAADAIQATADTEPLPLELPNLDEFADGSGDGGENITLDDFFDAFSDF